MVVVFVVCVDEFVDVGEGGGGYPLGMEMRWRRWQP